MSQSCFLSAFFTLKVNLPFRSKLNSREKDLDFKTIIIFSIVLTEIEN